MRAKRPRLGQVAGQSRQVGLRQAEVVGGRLQQFSGAWQKVVRSGEVQEWVTRGYTIPFSTKPPLTEPSSRCVTRLPTARMQVVRQEIQQLLVKRAIRVVPRTEAKSRDSLGFFSKMFCVQKPNGKWRPIINLKPMNRFVAKQKFRMETVQDVREMLRPGDFGATIDLQDAYYHVPVAKRSRRYLRFMLDGVVYEYQALPMGLTCSPRVFTGINKVLGTLFRRHGIRVVFYIDDIVVLGVSEEDCRQRVLFVLQSLRGLGFLINSAKSHLVPSQSFTYLGLQWDTKNWRISLKSDREVAIRARARHILDKEVVTCREVSRLVGQVLSTRDAVPLARGRIRRVQWEFLKSCPDQSRLNSLMFLSEEAREELQFWAHLEPGLSWCSGRGAGLFRDQVPARSSRLASYGSSGDCQAGQYQELAGLSPGCGHSQESRGLGRSSLDLFDILCLRTITWKTRLSTTLTFSDWLVGR